MSDNSNIIWITIDSVRFDHTSLSEYHRDTTPVLREFSDREDTISFSNCISHGFGTRQSTASMFTARHPGGHGASTMANTVLSSQVPTLAELLNQQGYFTSGVSTNAHISNETGLSRGFEDFTWISPKNLREIGLRPILKMLLNLRKHSVGFEADPGLHSSELLVNEVIKNKEKMLAEKEPFLLFAHYNGPHAPYYPPLPWVDEYLEELGVNKSKARWIGKQAHYRIHPNRESDINSEIGHWDEQKHKVLRALYDAYLKYTDYMVGELLEYISELDIGETIIIVTSDHGELLGEGGLFAHTNLHDTSLPLAPEPSINIPLIVRNIKGFNDPSKLVQHADISLILSKYIGNPFENHDAIDIRYEDRPYSVTQAFEPSVTAIRTNEFRYEDGNGVERLFDLDDRYQDLSGECPELVQELSEISSEINKEPGKAASLSGDAREQLEDLGYIV